MAAVAPLDPEKLYALSAELRKMAETLSPPAPGPEVSADFIRSIIRARRLRAHYLDAELFADPAWDMMLDLLAARIEGRRVSVTSLCIAAAVPPTTALRWIDNLCAAGAFVRSPDTKDTRRRFIALSDRTAERLTAYLMAAQARTDLLA